MTSPEPIPFGRFFLPGPTEVRPEVLRAMAKPVIGHRGAEMRELLGAVQPGLQSLFRTDRPVYVSTSSATGLMEAGVRNGVRDRALALVNGAFSGRFRDLVVDCGREVDVYEVAPGRAHEPEEVERRLRSGQCDAVTLVHSETSTGVLNPLAEIAEAVRNAERAAGREILILVDAVTSVGGVRVETRDWLLDWTLTGSQKALALPPGLAFGVASRRMLDRAATLPGRGQYFDLLEFERNAKSSQTPNTPAVSLMFALEEQLRHVARESVDGRIARHLAMMERCHAWVRAQGASYGMHLFAQAGREAPTVSAIALPEDRAGSGIVRALRDRGFTIAAGYGGLKDRTIRIGHMGDHTVEELDALLNELERVLES